MAHDPSPDEATTSTPPSTPSVTAAVDVAQSARTTPRAAGVQAADAARPRSAFALPIRTNRAPPPPGRLPSLRHAITTHSDTAPSNGREASEVLEVFDAEEWDPKAYDPTDWASPEKKSEALAAGSFVAGTSLPVAGSLPATGSAPNAGSVAAAPAGPVAARLPRPITSTVLSRIEDEQAKAAATPPTGSPAIASTPVSALPSIIHDEPSAPLHLSSEPETRALVAELVEQVIAHAQTQRASQVGGQSHGAMRSQTNLRRGLFGMHGVFRRGVWLSAAAVVVVLIGLVTVKGGASDSNHSSTPVQALRPHGDHLPLAASQSDEPAPVKAEQAAALPTKHGAEQALAVEPPPPIDVNEKEAEASDTATPVADDVPSPPLQPEVELNVHDKAARAEVLLAADQAPSRKDEGERVGGTNATRGAKSKPHKDKAATPAPAPAAPATSTSKPTPAPASVPEHKRLLQEAQKASGKAAYDLASASYAIKPSDAALFRMTTAACQMKREDLARSAFRRLPMMSDGRKHARDRCKAQNIRLGLGF